jgi:hypothetical protein
MVAMVIRASWIAYGRERPLYRSDGQKERRGLRSRATAVIDLFSDRSPPVFPMAIGKTGQLFAIRVNKCEKPGAGQDAIYLSTAQQVSAWTPDKRLQRFPG